MYTVHKNQFVHGIVGHRRFRKPKPFPPGGNLNNNPSLKTPPCRQMLAESNAVETNLLCSSGENDGDPAVARVEIQFAQHDEESSPDMDAASHYNEKPTRKPAAQVAAAAAAATTRTGTTTVTEDDRPESSSPLSCGDSPEDFFGADWLNTTCDNDMLMDAQNIPLPPSAEDDDDNNNNNNKDDDDSASAASAASSTAYYDPSDFSAANWLKALDAPAFGLAVVALTTAITHPLLFLAGTVAAFTTMAAATHGYDICGGDGNNSSSSSVWTSWSQSWFGFWENPATGPVAAAAAVTVSGRGAGQDHANTHSDNSGHHAAKGKTLSDESTLGSSHTAEYYETDAAADRNKRAGSLSLEDDVMSRSKMYLVSDSALATLPDEVVPPFWLDQHYPALNVCVVRDREFLGLNANEFFHVFLADNAPFNFLQFQKKRGDLEIHYGTWQHLTGTSSLSMVPAASAHPFPTDLSYLFWGGRSIRFKAKTNSFIGPAFATTTKTQRMLILSKRVAVLESRTDLADIPFCDRFYVMERWVITAHKDNGRYTARLSAWCEVTFTASCPFERQIRTRSAATMREVVAAWCDMASEALKLTEQAKLDRLRRSHLDGSHNTEEYVASSRGAVTRENGVLSHVGSGGGRADEAVEVRHDADTYQLAVGEEELLPSQGGTTSLLLVARRRRSDSEQAPPSRLVRTTMTTTAVTAQLRPTRTNPLVAIRRSISQFSLHRPRAGVAAVSTLPPKHRSCEDLSLLKTHTPLKQ